MSKLAGFDEAPVYERLPKLSVAEAAGTYVMEVREFVKFTSANDDSQEYFKATFRILEASPGAGYAVGDEVCELEALFGQYKKSAFGRVKSIIGACTGVRGAEVTVPDFEEAVAADNPCKGSKVKVFATPKAGTSFCQLAWTTYRPGPTAAAPTPA